jgi:hypothetical protein
MNLDFDVKKTVTSLTRSTPEALVPGPMPLDLRVHPFARERWLTTHDAVLAAVGTREVIVPFVAACVSH